MTSIEFARKMENDSISFYREAAEKMRNSVGKRLFLSIIVDEKRNLSWNRSVRPLTAPDTR